MWQAGCSWLMMSDLSVIWSLDSPNGVRLSRSVDLPSARLLEADSSLAWRCITAYPPKGPFPSSSTGVRNLGVGLRAVGHGGNKGATSPSRYGPRTDRSPPRSDNRICSGKPVGSKSAETPRSNPQTDQIVCSPFGGYAWPPPPGEACAELLPSALRLLPKLPYTIDVILGRGRRLPAHAGRDRRQSCLRLRRPRAGQSAAEHTVVRIGLSHRLSGPLIKCSKASRISVSRSCESSVTSTLWRWPPQNDGIYCVILHQAAILADSDVAVLPSATRRTTSVSMTGSIDFADQTGRLRTMTCGIRLVRGDRCRAWRAGHIARLAIYRELGAALRAGPRFARLDSAVRAHPAVVSTHAGTMPGAFLDSPSVHGNACSRCDR
jgi:hypothetical protein